MKKEEKYRDRASERRVGKDNDFTQVEALLQDFNESTAKDDKQSVRQLIASYSRLDIRQIEEKRRYLGGDSEHTVLVKGLDFALLEQNKAKAAISATADEDLEQAFTEAPKKRTKEDIVRELKEKRAKEAALPNTKFKPIGFKPVEEPKKKKKKAKAIEGEGKKKKRKQDAPPIAEPEPQPVPSSSSTHLPEPQPVQEPEPAEDFDIFEGAGEYGGLDVSDDDESGDETTRPAVDDAPLVRPGHWFDEPSKSPDPDPVPEPSSQHQIQIPLPAESDDEQDVPMRLVPLEGSSIPSIKDLLALDQSANKKRKRKEKGKGKKDDSGDAAKVSAEVKAERDYKKYVVRCFRVLCLIILSQVKVISGEKGCFCQVDM